VTLVSIAVMASPTGATPPTSETITLVRAYPGGPPDGWFASGTVFSDSGSWTDDRFVGGGPSPVEFAGHFFETATSQTGDTIKLRYVLSSNAVQEQDLCEIVGGTGKYAKLHGQGTWTLEFPTTGVFAGKLLIVCTALVHIS
jgi:hypothetical protein